MLVHRCRVLSFALLLSTSVARASELQPDEVPLFQLRARVTSSGGIPTSGTDREFSFDVRGAVAKSLGDRWSDWMTFARPQAESTIKDYPAQYIPRWPIVQRLIVTSGAADPCILDAELKFGEGGEPIALHGELFGRQLGVNIWRDESGKPRAATMADYDQRYWREFAGLRPMADRRPQHFPIVDRFIGADDDRAHWRNGIEHLRAAGLSAIMLPPDRHVRDLLLEAGGKRTAWAVYSPPGYAFDYGDDATPERVVAWAEGEARAYRDAGYAPRDMAIFAMSDEPGWYYPQMYQTLRVHPAALARFRQYLAEQNLQPADLGRGDWAEVFPLGRSGAKDPGSRRLFYWTQRFFAWDSARHFAASTAALERAFYPGMPIITNWNFFSGRLYVPGPVANNSAKQDPDAAMGGHDWFEYARLRGATMLWTEDWFSDAQAYQWSFYCSKLRSAATRGGIEFGGYVIPRTAGDRPDGIVQKILSVVGHGGKAVKYFVFGPEYAFPSNCYSENAGVIRQMAAAHAMIAAAEPVLWPGRMPRPQTAILAPRSAEMWDAKQIALPDQIEDATNNHLNNSTVDYMAEVFDIYLALQHANLPADFVSEDDLSAEGLKDYRVLYVTEPNLPIEGQQALAAWVRGGGTLVTVSGAAAYDRYDDRCVALRQALGIVEEPRARLLVPGLAQLSAAGTGDGARGAFTAVGARGRLTAESPDVVARFADASPAVTERKIDRGRSIHFAWLPGLSYASSTTGTQDKLPVGFSASLREWITYPVKVADVDVPVKLSHPMVESPLLTSAAGGAITLLNWTGERIGELQVDARLPFKARSVQSVKHGLLPLAQSAERIRVTLPLDAADILIVRP